MQGGKTPGGVIAPPTLFSHKSERVMSIALIDRSTKPSTNRSAITSRSKKERKEKKKKSPSVKKDTHRRLPLPVSSSIRSPKPFARLWIISPNGNQIRQSPINLCLATVRPNSAPKKRRKRPKKKKKEEEEERRKLVTNLQNGGLISTDRGTKATLTLTIPRSIFKSFTKDLSRSIFELVFQHRSHAHFTERRAVYNVMISNRPERRLILTQDNIRASYISPLSSMDSGLEAFSRNPTHGSFSALTFQSTDLPIM